MSSVKSNVLAILDIGSTWVRALVCERDENGIFRIVGMGIRISTGLRKGVVVNIESTLHAIAGAIEDAEVMSGLELHDFWVGIGGNHVSGFNSRGVAGVTHKKKDSIEREIGPEDIERVIEGAKSVMIPTDRRILEVIPQSFKVDDQKGIKNPLNIIGVRLECEVHIITCTLTGAHNLIKCVNRAGFTVNDLILQTLAAGQAVITQDEKDLGAVLLDMGGGTTEMLVYVDGSPYSMYTIPAGGTQVTSDISIIKNISIDNAEKIKIEAGCCWESLVDEDEFVIVPGVGGRPPMSIPRTQLLQIIKPRIEELFKMAKDHLDSLNLMRPLGGGVIITGGGARLNGVVELANHVLKLPARIGVPIPTQALNGLIEEYCTPENATAVGLVLESIKRSSVYKDNDSELRKSEKKGAALFKKFTDWLTEEFS